MRSSIAVLGVTAVLLLTACGGGKPVSSSTSSNSPASATGDATPDVVTIKDFKFAPAALTVKTGHTITFINQDSQAHTATADTSGAFDAGSIAAGASATQRFDTAGTFAYHCSFHPFMEATITVTS